MLGGFHILVEIKDLDNIFHIPEPWYINNCIFDENKKQLDVYVKVDKKAPMTCSNCGANQQRFFDIADYDRTWRHLNFLEYPCYIHAEHPRTACKKCGKKHRKAIKPRANFTNCLIRL